METQNYTHLEEEQLGILHIFENNETGDNDEQMIGFVMIDRKYQNQGYGRLAMKKILEYIRTFPAGPAEYCWMQYEETL